MSAHLSVTHRRHGRTLPSWTVAVAAASFVWIALPGATAVAQDSGSTRDAGKHFQRGVALYGETDYRAALVEFKRAYALSPNAAVLYNVGETEFQLQDYAGALTTFERYLAEASSSDSHRSEVESNVEVLRARVGHVAITTIPSGAEIAVDDQNFGKTPLEKSILVSIGHRKIVASMPGRPSLTRYVDVAADDNLTVTLQLAAPADSSPSSSLKAAAPTKEAEPDRDNGATLRAAGWIGTGLLGAGAITFAVLADRESSTLQRMRSTYPTSASDLTHEASLTSTYSLVADSLTAAAIVVGAISAYMTFSSSSTDSKRGSAGDVRVGVGPGSARFEMTF